MRRAILLALLLVPALPLAMGGTANDPEIADAADNQNPGFDITKVWFETTDDGLRFTIEILEQRGSAAHRFTRVGFAIDGLEYRGVIGWDGSGRVRTHAMKGVIQLGTPGLERWASDNLVDVDVRYGAPARFAATIPWNTFEDLQPGAVLERLAASVSVYSPSTERWTRVEYAESARTYTVESPTAPLVRIAQGGSVGPLLIAAAVLVAGILGFAWWRARRAPVGPAHVETGKPAQPPEAPPATAPALRIRLDPREPE